MIYYIDFKKRKLINTIPNPPKQTKWQCDGCHQNFIHIEDSEDNMEKLNISKVVHMKDKPYKLEVHLCRVCCTDTIPKLFEEGE